MHNEINNKGVYYLELSYLENSVKTDKILSTMIENYHENMETKLNEQEEKINKMNIYIETMEGNIINNDVDIQLIQDKILQIEQELQIKHQEIQIKELQESKIVNPLYIIQYIVLIVLIILF
jgi:formate dehydrogenase maturation protein FdhE